jgi:error-prone DNA polymerase
LKDHNIGLFAEQPIDTSAETNIELPEMNLFQHVLEDYKTIALSLKAHPVSFIRNKLAKLHVVANHELS